MRVLGLDQALNTSGVCIYEDGEVLYTGTFSTKSSSPIEERLLQFAHALDKLYDEWHFEHIFFEDTQKQANTETFRKLCYVQAAVIIWCYNDTFTMPFTILAPSHWRKLLNEKYGATYGRARADQKAGARKFVQDHFGLSIGEDASDAVNIAVAGMIEYNKNRSAF